MAKQMMVLFFMLFVFLQCAKSEDIVCKYEFDTKQIEIKAESNKKDYFIGHMKIHIDNFNSFDDFKDYLIIRDEYGRKMTYNLSCSHI